MSARRRIVQCLNARGIRHQVDIVPINVLEMPDPASDPSHSGGLSLSVVSSENRFMKGKTHLRESRVRSNFIAEQCDPRLGMQAVATNNDAAFDCLAVIKHRCNGVICMLDCS